MKLIRLSIPLLFILANSTALGTEFKLASVFADSMVLQQRSLVPLWGWGVPGKKLDVRGSWGAHASGSIAADGSWRSFLKTPRAGGPFTVTLICGDTSVVLRDVLSGEVWLCSGQSNMEMPLAGWPPGDTIANSAETILNSENGDIRFFTVKRTCSLLPESLCDGKWVHASPASSPDFSATAYYFARKIQHDLRVPVGIIHSSWGGTPVESWLGRRSLSTVHEFDSVMHKIDLSVEGMTRLNRWFSGFPALDPDKKKPGDVRWKGLKFNDDSCSAPEFDDTRWNTMTLPTAWERTEVGDFDGVIWFRRSVPIPRSWLGKNLVIELGPIDDMDVTFVNGARVGGYEAEGCWKVDRIYTVPDSTVRDTVLHVAVRVLDYQGGGGIWGNKRTLCVHPADMIDTVFLGGEWKYLPVAQLFGERFYVFGLGGDQYVHRPKLPIEVSAQTPTMLSNGMIAPVAPYAVKGFVWYQGESNVGNPVLYARLFPLLIGDWRDMWSQQSLPFYYVQIAPYEYEVNSRSQLLREAQTQTLSVSNTGMAVTLDIGNPKNIHPSNKLDVGERLARWALAKTYGKPIPYSGPLLSKAVVRKDRVELRFTHAEKGLLVKPVAGKNGFQVAGDDRVFRDAVVKVVGSTLQVSHPDIQHPVAVRYAFTDAPDATFFNRAGLPAPSFRTDTWEE